MILQKTEVMLCVCLFVCLFFWETGLFLFLYFCLMNNCFFWRFWWGFFSYFFFFPAGFSNLMEVYRRFIVWQKSPSGFYHNSSQRLVFFSFLECYMLRFDELFCSCTNVPESFFFLLFRNFRKRKYSIQNRKMTYMTFLQMNSSAGFKEFI